MMPDGVCISAISPTDFPNKPFPIGESTEIFLAFKSASFSATMVYETSILFCTFLIFTVERINTLLLSISLSSINLALANLFLSFAILASNNP